LDLLNVRVNNNDHIVFKSQIYKDSHIPDAVMEVDDLDNIKRLAGLSNNNIGRLQEYTTPESVSTEGSNCSKTAMEKVNYQKEHDVQPGTPEWFRLWFSKPYLTGEKPW
jgi:hypothetical protein